MPWMAKEGVMKKIISRATAGTAAAITIAASFTGVVGATTFYHGDKRPPEMPSSYWSKSYDSTSLRNKAYVDIHNMNYQKASSGDVKVELDDDDATVGDITTGDATNTNTTSIVFSVTN